MIAPRAGYTLVEMVVVLLILAVSAAAAVPAFAAWRTASDLDVATARVVEALRLARERAIAGGRGSALVIDAANARIWLRPTDTSWVLALPRSCRLDGAPRLVVHFAADGPARGEVPLVRCGSDSARVTLDRITGMPSIAENP